MRRGALVFVWLGSTTHCSRLQWRAEKAEAQIFPHSEDIDGNARLEFGCCAQAGSPKRSGMQNHSESLSLFLLSNYVARCSRAGIPRDSILGLPTGPSIRRNAHRIVAPCLSAEASAALPRLFTSYGACIDLLLSEIANTRQGDEIELGIYLLEGGSSSEQILDALQEAGLHRGVHITFRLDVSYVSMISRLIEKTDTLIPRVAALAEAEPHWCSCTFGSKPDHSKFAIFTRQGTDRADSAVLGGINFGDRFQTWDDYSVRLPPPYVAKLRHQLYAAKTFEKANASMSFATSSPLAIARTIAIASPAVALTTLITFFAFVATVTILPISFALSDLGFSYLPLIATIEFSLFSSILGATFTTSCDGAPYSLLREIAGFTRSLIFDRSMLGDSLAPLRRLYFSADANALSSGPSSLDSFASDSRLRDCRYFQAPKLQKGPPVRFIANRRDARRYEIEPTFRSLFLDERLSHFRITMAYLGHRWGIELLELALRRGAKVELLLPSRSNVYACENRKSAQVLLDGRWPNLDLYLHPQMVHAKATLAWDASSDLALAFVGSANLVRGSMNLPVQCGLLPYDELNVLISEPVFCGALNVSMGELFKSARKIPSNENLLDDCTWYSDAKALWEELWQ